MKVSQANFHYFLSGDVFVILDLGNSISVTNDIENVMEVINSNVGGIGDRKVIYRDTDHIYDQVIIKDNKFSKFNLLQEKLYLSAIEKITGGRINGKRQSKNYRN